MDDLYMAAEERIVADLEDELGREPTALEIEIAVAEKLQDTVSDLYAEAVDRAHDSMDTER